MNQRTIGYSFVQALFWASYGIIIGFVSLYLLDAGFSNSIIGVLIALSGIASAILQPLVADFADKSEKISLRQIILGVGSVTLLCAIGLLIFRGNYYLTGAFYSSAMVLLQMTTPLVSSLGVESTNYDEKFNFGIARGMGSLGYAITVYVMGIFTKNFGAFSVPISMFVAVLLMIVSVVVYPIVPKTTSGQTASEKKSSGSAFGFFQKYPRYMLLLLGCILLFLSHIVLNSFTFQIVTAKGGNSSQMGFAMGLASLLEIPILFLFGWMLTKKSCDFWFRITGIFFTLKILGTFLCTNMTGFYLVQIFQPFAWGIITVSSVYYINHIMQQEDSVKGQAYYNVSLTLGNVFGSLICGRILDLLGVNAMLIFGTICATVGAIILLLFTEKVKA